MKSKAIALLLASALASTSVGAFAQGRPGPDDHRGPDQHGGPGPQGGPHGGPQMHADDHGGGRGPVPHSDWRRGQRIPNDYRDNRYVVNDWHAHGLRQPPRGYQWRQVNGDYVMVAIATGVISSILLSNH